MRQQLSVMPGGFHSDEHFGTRTKFVQQPGQQRVPAPIAGKQLRSQNDLAKIINPANRVSFLSNVDSHVVHLLSFSWLGAEVLLRTAGRPMLAARQGVRKVEKPPPHQAIRDRTGKQWTGMHPVLSQRYHPQPCVVRIASRKNITRRQALLNPVPWVAASCLVNPTRKAIHKEKVAKRNHAELPAAC
jgi:hypothetical protein